MAEVSAQMADVTTKPTKKGRSRKALNQTNPSPSDSNVIVSPVVVVNPPEASASLDKENQGNLSNPKSLKNAKKGASSKNSKQGAASFEKEMQEMQEKMERLKLEKEKTEEMLKATEESLKQKEDAIETRDKEQEKLKAELKKLQKMKEFKPNMTLPLGFQLGEGEPEKKDKKKSSIKKPSPPYVLWCKDQWNEVKKENPEADFKEMSNLMASKWKTVTPEEKKPYEEKYQAEKEAYSKLMGHEKREKDAMKLLEEEHKQKTAMELLEQYLAFRQETENENKKKKPTKKEKDPLKPKQPLSAYFIFCSERRGALTAENKNVLEIAKITSEEWKNLSAAQKSPYEEMALKNKERYVREMEAYKQMKEEEAANLKKEEEEAVKLQKQEALQLLKKKEKAENLMKKAKVEKQKQKKEKKVVDPNKPKKPASSFLLFSKETRKNLLQERPEISDNATINALISVKWKELKEEERRIWNEKAGLAMEAYKKELEEYNKKVVAEAEN